MSGFLLFCVFIAYGISQCSGCTRDQNKNASAKINFVPFPDNLKKYEVPPWEILKLSDFNRSYKEILGSKIKEHWLESLGGPSTKNKLIMTPQGNCVVVHSCMQHNCDTHMILILFNPENGYCWAMLVEEEKIHWFGQPNDDIKGLMRKIGKITWPYITPGIFDQD